MRRGGLVVARSRVGSRYHYLWRWRRAGAGSRSTGWLEASSDKRKSSKVLYVFNKRWQLVGPVVWLGFVVGACGRGRERGWWYSVGSEAVEGTRASGASGASVGAAGGRELGGRKA